MMLLNSNCCQTFATIAALDDLVNTEQIGNKMVRLSTRLTVKDRSKKHNRRRQSDSERLHLEDNFGTERDTPCELTQRPD